MQHGTFCYVHVLWMLEGFGSPSQFSVVCGTDYYVAYLHLSTMQSLCSPAQRRCIARHNLTFHVSVVSAGLEAWSHTHASGQYGLVGYCQHQSGILSGVRRRENPLTKQPCKVLRPCFGSVPNAQQSKEHGWSATLVAYRQAVRRVLRRLLADASP